MQRVNHIHKQGNKTPTEALTPPAEKKIGKIDTYYATAQAVVNIKVAIILYYF